MTWTIKVRTSPGALMTADYECPVHGRFEALVSRDGEGNPPIEAPCQTVLAAEAPGFRMERGCWIPSPLDTIWWSMTAEDRFDAVAGGTSVP